jgi:hypothetical protein
MNVQEGYRRVPLELKNVFDVLQHIVREIQFYEMFELAEAKSGFNLCYGTPRTLLPFRNRYCRLGRFRRPLMS